MLARLLLILLIFSKNYFLLFFTIPLLPVSLISTLIFIISFLLLNLDLIFSFSFLVSKVEAEFIDLRTCFFSIIGVYILFCQCSFSDTLQFQVSCVSTFIWLPFQFCFLTRGLFRVYYLFSKYLRIFQRSIYCLFQI